MLTCIAVAKPEDIRFGGHLPKTRSGKIMRRTAGAARAHQSGLLPVL